MATIPVQRTWTTGEIVTAAMLNDDVRDAGNFFKSMPNASVYNSAGQTLSNNTITSITHDSENADNDTMHSTSSNTSRLTATTAGVYDISGAICFASNATGRRDAFLRLNGVTYLDEDKRAAVSGDTTTVKVSRTYRLAAGDYVELQGRQTSGGSLATDVTNGGVHFEMKWTAE